jgi:hypothetical protein
MPFREMLNRALGSSCIIAMSLFLRPNNAQAQLSFGGYAHSHFAGIYGVPSNPASAAATHYKWDVNIGGVDAGFGNTYAKFPRATLLHPPDSLSALKRGRDYFLDTASTKKQFAWGNMDIMMPSILYSIDEIQSIAFTWRVRAQANAGNINTDVANFFALNFPNPQFNGKTINMPLANGSFNFWNQFGFTYARVILDDDMHRLKAGVTLNILSGIAAGYAQAEDVSFVMNNANNAGINSGVLKMGYSKGIEDWQKPNASNYKVFGKMGLGMDLGVTYEWREEVDGLDAYEDDWNVDADDYKLRIGASITDLGGIRYKKSPSNTDLNLQAENLDPQLIKMQKNEGWQHYYRRISQYFTPIASNNSFRMGLPTALNMNADYNVDGRFFVNMNSVIALTTGQYNPSKTYAMTQIQITPRYDLRNFGAYVPLELNAHGQFDMGVGLRAGPLVIGSSTLLSNLFQKDKSRMNGFIALRIVPIKLGAQKLGCPAAQF